MTTKTYPDPSQTFDQRVTESIAATQEPNGFPVDASTGEVDRSSSSISFDDGTRTFTISPSGGSYTVWVSGQQFEVTKDFTVQSDDVNGEWFFYFDVVGNDLTLIADQVGTPQLIYNRGFCAFGYWDTTNKKMLFGGVLDERHGTKLDGHAHYWMHRETGTRYESGLDFNNIQADGSGNADGSAQFGVDAGAVYDEDLRFDIAEILSTACVNRIIYKEATGEWREQTPISSFPVLNSGSGRIAYNPPSGGLLEIANNDFCLYHYIATSGQDTNGQVIGIPGQVDYPTLNNIRNNAQEEINNLVLDGLPLQEFKFIGSILWQTSSGYNNPVKSRIRSTDNGFDYLDYKTPYIEAVERDT